MCVQIILPIYTANTRVLWNNRPPPPCSIGQIGQRGRHRHRHRRSDQRGHRRIRLPIKEDIGVLKRLCACVAITQLSSSAILLSSSAVRISFPPFFSTRFPTFDECYCVLDCSLCDAIEPLKIGDCSCYPN